MDWMIYGANGYTGELIAREAKSRGGTPVAVHRPYFEKGYFGNLTEAEAKKAFDTLQDSAREYMLEMGVPKHIQEDVLGTPSDRALILDEKTKVVIARGPGISLALSGGRLDRRVASCHQTASLAQAGFRPF